MTIIIIILLLSDFDIVVGQKYFYELKKQLKCCSGNYCIVTIILSMGIHFTSFTIILSGVKIASNEKLKFEKAVFKDGHVKNQDCWYLR